MKIICNMSDRIIEDMHSDFILSLFLVIAFTLIIIVGAFEFLIDKETPSDTEAPAGNGTPVQLNASYFIFWLVSFGFIMLLVLKLIEMSAKH